MRTLDHLLCPERWIVELLMALLGTVCMHKRITLEQDTRYIGNPHQRLPVQTITHPYFVRRAYTFTSSKEWSFKVDEIEAKSHQIECIDRNCGRIPRID